MFRIIKTAILLSLGLIGIFAFHTIVNYFFAFPLNKVNVVFLLLIWIISYKHHITMLWLALSLSFVMEMFSSLPFGITTAATITTLVFIRYIFSFLFTNFSWYSMFLLGFLSILLQKIISAGIIYFLSIFKKIEYTLQFPDPYLILLECAVNASLLMVIYLLLGILKQKRKYSHSF